MKLNKEELEKARYSSPIFDTPFSMLMGSEQHKNCLISFLNAILKLNEKEKIIDVEYRNRCLVPEEIDGKQAILDIFCTDTRDEKFLIEMQIAKQDYFFKRALFYSCRAYTSQFKQGDKYSNLTKVVFIAILKDSIIENYDHHISCYELVNIENNFQIDLLKFVFIELDKFKTPLDENATLAEKWLHVLQSAHTYEDIPEYLQEEVFTEAFRVLDKTKWKEKEMKNYSLELQREEERKDSIAYEVRLAVEKATKQAITEGELKGRLEGKHEREIEIISNMLEAGMNAAQIAKLTKMSEEEIQKLKR